MPDQVGDYPPGLERLNNPSYSALVDLYCGCCKYMAEDIPWEYWVHPDDGQAYPYVDFRKVTQRMMDWWLSQGINVGEFLKDLGDAPPGGAERLRHEQELDVLTVAGTFVRDDRSGHPDRR